MSGRCRSSGGSRGQRQAPICLHGQGRAGSRGAAAACALSRPLARVAGSCNSRDSWVSRVLCWRARGRRMARGWNRSMGECALRARCAVRWPKQGPEGEPVEGMTSRSYLSSAAGKGTAHMTCPCAGLDRGPVGGLLGQLGWAGSVSLSPISFSFSISFCIMLHFFHVYKSKWHISPLV